MNREFLRFGDFIVKDAWISSFLGGHLVRCGSPLKKPILLRAHLCGGLASGLKATNLCLY